MRIRYFTDTDTLLIEFKDRPVAETRDLDENTILDVDEWKHGGRPVTISSHGFLG